MSTILNGLCRVSYDYFDAGDIVTVNGEESLLRWQINEVNNILLDQCYELEYEATGFEEVITTCEKYLVNSQKMHVLENSVFFIRRIFFMVRPLHAC